MAVSNNLNQSSIRDYLPSKVISGYAQTVDPLESWLYNDGMGDPWWQGAGGAAYKWKVTATVNTMSHGSHLTRNPYAYTGLDITPGMWVFAASDARALLITSVVSATDSDITFIIEDVDRYNTFNNSQGSGAFNYLSDIIFFELGDDGLPVIDKYPESITDPGVVSQVEARFRVFNSTVKYKFLQVNHGFKEGNVLTMDSETKQFRNATSDDIYLAGTVVATGPGPNFFYLSPSTKIIKDLEPGLPGNIGDVLWIDTLSGDITTTPNGSNAPVYIKLSEATPSYNIGTVDNPTTYYGNSIKLNNQLIVFDTVVDDMAPTTDIISKINASTEEHGVIASFGSPSNKISGTVEYPSTLVQDPWLQVKINDVLITIQPPSINFGDGNNIGFWDIVRSVNELYEQHGVYATMDLFSGMLSFENAAGNAITFENISPTTSSNGYQTFTDCVGVQTDNQPAAATKLKLSRADGGAITITQVNGTFLSDTGCASVSNGALPLALVVDKSMSASKSYVVNSLSDRDALPNIRTGDQVFVQHAKDNGEWALFVRTSETWTVISTQDSSTVDAKTLTGEVFWNSVTPVTIGSISSGTRIVNVMIQIITPFSADAVISIGTMDNQTVIFDPQNVDVTIPGSYESGSSFIYSGPSASEDEIMVFLTPGSSTEGEARVIVSYM